MPEGQNRGAECFAVLKFEDVLGRKIQIICDGYIGGDLPQVWSEAKILNRLCRIVLRCLSLRAHWGGNFKSFEPNI